MRTKLFVIAILGVSIITLTACVKQEIKNINSRGENIVCFGNSLTFGYGVEKGQDYPSQLEKMLNYACL
ncbi:MAG: arylesterase, partial [Candidatus Omnitrophica bacterium]|nr:arylesterase [Candidatus Omnitrophota bacterium]